MENFFRTLGDAWTLYHTIELIIAIILFFIGLFGWGYIISANDETTRELLIVEVIVQVAVLAGSIIRIGIFDYEENIRFHIRATFAVDVLLSVIGYYIAGIHVFRLTGAVQAEVFYYIMDFFVELLIGAVLGFLPSIIIAVLMWALVRIFARPL